LSFTRFFDIDRETIKNRVQDAANLAGGDQVDEELIEDLGVASQRF
jgi:hypothetical protein